MKNKIFEGMNHISVILDNYYESDKVVDSVHFSQTWADTSLGFGMFGGQAFTSALTSVIFLDDGKIDVWFAGQKAYTVPRMNQAFFEDLSKRWLKSVHESIVYMN